MSYMYFTDLSRTTCALSRTVRDCSLFMPKGGSVILKQFRHMKNLPLPGSGYFKKLPSRLWTSRQNVYACARLRISGLFFSQTFESDQSLPRALGFILCAACGSVVLLHAARVSGYFVVIEIAFMDNQAQITETISRLDSEKVRW